MLTNTDLYPYKKFHKDWLFLFFTVHWNLDRPHFLGLDHIQHPATRSVDSWCRSGKLLHFVKWATVLRGLQCHDPHLVWWPAQVRVAPTGTALRSALGVNTALFCSFSVWSRGAKVQNSSLSQGEPKLPSSPLQTQIQVQILKRVGRKREWGWLSLLARQMEGFRCPLWDLEILVFA